MIYMVTFTINISPMLAYIIYTIHGSYGILNNWKLSTMIRNLCLLLPGWTKKQAQLAIGDDQGWIGLTISMELSKTSTESLAFSTCVMFHKFHINCESPHKTPTSETICV